MFRVVHLLAAVVIAAVVIVAVWHITPPSEFKTRVRAGDPRAAVESIWR